MAAAAAAHPRKEGTPRHRSLHPLERRCQLAIGDSQLLRTAVKRMGEGGDDAPLPACVVHLCLLCCAPRALARAHSARRGVNLLLCSIHNPTLHARQYRLQDGLQPAGHDLLSPTTIADCAAALACTVPRTRSPPTPATHPPPAPPAAATAPIALPAPSTGTRHCHRTRCHPQWQGRAGRQPLRDVQGVSHTACALRAACNVAHQPPPQSPAPRLTRRRPHSTVAARAHTCM